MPDTQAQKKGDYTLYITNKGGLITAIVIQQQLLTHGFFDHAHDT